MQNKALSSIRLANLGLDIGLDFGFNACKATTQFDIHHGSMRGELIFGNRDTLRITQAHAGQTVNLAYDTSVPCYRNEQVHIWISCHDSVESLRSKITPQLFEFVHDATAVDV